MTCYPEAGGSRLGGIPEYIDSYPRRLEEAQRGSPASHHVDFAFFQWEPVQALHVSGPVQSSTSGAGGSQSIAKAGGVSGCLGKEHELKVEILTALGATTVGGC